MEHFKQPEQFISLNGQIIALPAEPENPLRTAEMTVEDDYGMIDGVLNNGRKGEELEKAQGERAGPRRRRSPPSGSGWRRPNGSAVSTSPRTGPSRRNPPSMTYEP